MLGFSFEKFPGFDAKDFDAFLKHKWSSHRYNLERRRTRAKLEALGHELSGLLKEETKGLILKTTLDHPHVFNRNCVSEMWLYFDRPEEQKRDLEKYIDKNIPLRERVDDPVPEHHFATCGVVVDSEGVRIQFMLHSHAIVDKRNLEGILSDPLEARQVVALLSSLPGEYVLVIDDTKYKHTKIEELQVEKLREHVSDFSDWFAVQYTFPRDCHEVGQPEFRDTIADLLRGLLRLWHFVAWSRYNDKIKLVKTIKEEKKKLREKLAGFKRGDKVVVTAGLLVGKVGTVEDVDSKGKVKVAFGILSMEMEPYMLKLVKK